MRVSHWLSVACVGLGAVASPASPATAPIYKVVLDDVIHGVTAAHVIETLDQAGRDGAELVLVQLHTPGGLLSSTRDLIEAILNSPTPVVVYVAPAGSHAASAGFLILLASDAAVMAPGTNTGAATPISGTGQELQETLQKKVTSDAAAYARTIAERRGRSPDIAQKAVTETLSWTSAEAQELGLIDFVARSEPELLEWLDGRTFERADGSSVTVRTAGREVVVHEMSRKQEILAFVANPNIAVVLGLLGFAGLYLEFSNPGTLVPGLVGGICLLLAAFAFEILPVNVVGLVLATAGLGLLLVEAFTPSFGVLGGSGVVALVLGALFLFEEQALPTPALRVSPGLIVPVAILLAVMVVLVGRMVVQAQTRPPATGREALIGRTATARTAIDGEGKVFLNGEYWDAVARESIAEGEQVRVLSVEGLTLSVERAAEGAAREGAR